MDETTPLPPPGHGATAKIMVLLALVVVGAGLWGYNWYSQKDDPKSTMFVGQVQEVKDGALLVKGRYYVDPASNKNVHVVAPEQTVTVKIDGETKFVKTKIFLPTQEELKATGGVYKADDLRRETSGGQLQEIYTDLSIDVHSKKDVFGKESIIASEIEYKEPIYP